MSAELLAEGSAQEQDHVGKIIVEKINFVHHANHSDLPSKPIIARSSGFDTALCPSCGGTRVNLVRMPDFSTHHAARRCGGCDRFLSWEPKPKTQQKRHQLQQVIGYLLQSPGLSEWEIGFLRGLKVEKLSPKQREVLDRLAEKVGGQG